MPGGLATPGTGHQVQSLLSPPIRSSGAWPGARSRISCSNTGLTAFGSLPAYAKTAGYSNDSPRKPDGIVLPVGAALTVSASVVGAAAAPPSWALVRCEAIS